MADASNLPGAPGHGDAIADEVNKSTEDAVKVILLGDTAVGKSKLVERFLMNGYQPCRLSTYALTLYRHDWKHPDGRAIHVDFWDTAGQEQFAKVHPSYYYRAHACMFVFDVTRKLTYKALDRWLSELREYSEANIPCVVLANKIDVDYKVTSKSFAFAEKNKMPFFFVSASDGTNVVKAFQTAMSLGLKKKEAPPEGLDAEIMALLEDPTLGQVDASLITPKDGDDFLSGDRA
ncbi:Rab-like protein 2 [Pycnococcus provasolii]